MDLKSGAPFWPIKNGLMHTYPPLTEDVRCAVAVVGAGITGALIAHELATHGHDVVVIDERAAGQGSTAASTALIQYEIDTHLVDLAKRYGERDAVLAYRACADAIGALEGVAREVRDVDFQRRDSLYYASRRGHRRALLDEHALRAKHGLPVEWLDPGPLRDRYSLDAPGAIVTTLAASLDPYRLAHRLLAKLDRVFTRTAVTAIEPAPRGVTLRTDRGPSVRADHVVMAAGYAGARWLDRRVARNHSSYAVISEPIAADALGVVARTVVWESARPYLYLRTTGEGRLLIGGEDDTLDVPARRDARVGGRAQTLLRKARARFPGLPIEPAYAWAGTFAETDDGLPFFGPSPQHGPRVHFAMAYGGNGITYSMIGAGLVRAGIERRRHPLAALFAFRRLGPPA